MKKHFILLLTMLAGFVMAGAQEQALLKLYDFKPYSTNADNQTVNILKVDFPTDNNAKEGNTVLIRVLFKNMTNEEAQKVTFDFGNNVSVVSSNPSKLYAPGDNSLWLFVQAPANPKIPTYMTATYNNFRSEELSIPEMKPLTIYNVTVENSETLPVTFSIKPNDCKVMIANNSALSGTAVGEHLTIGNVPQGKHAIVISKDGRMLHTGEINVIKTLSQTFSFDLRQLVPVTISTKPDEAEVFVKTDEDTDFKPVGKSPYSAKFPLGSTLEVRAVKDQHSDDGILVVNNQYNNSILLEPVKHKEFDVYATYGGDRTSASLYVNGKRRGDSDSLVYHFNEPIGRELRMEMNKYGRTKSKTIKVSNRMKASQVFKISAKNPFVWPWQKEFDPVIGGVSIGYVQKQYVTMGYGDKLAENIWGDNGWVHGMQFGFHVEPAFHWGLGLYTGLFYELYLSSSNEHTDWSGDYTDFIEHSLYIPVHAYYRLPLARKVYIAVHGGIGFDWVVYGAFKTSNSSIDEIEYDDFTDFYGEQGFPKRVNLSGEISVDLRFGPVMVTGTYSKGLLNHGSYSEFGDEYKTKQNKMSLSVSYVFGSGE